MKLKYNGVALDELAAKVSIVGQSSQGEPSHAPHSWIKTLRVRLSFEESSYAENHALSRQIEAVLNQQEAVLEWKDENDTTIINQTATIVDHDRPEQPNAYGTYLQTLTITFRYTVSFSAAQAEYQGASYTRSGSAAAVTLSFPERFKLEQDHRRYDSMRPHRNEVTGRITASGKFKSTPTKTVAERRAELNVKLDEMNTAILNGKDGTFVFGPVNKLVKIEQFSADIDQEHMFIAWSLSATFTSFPNQAGYAQCEFRAGHRENKESGEATFGFSGTIAAESEANALAKLAAVRAAAVPSGYVALKQQRTPEKLDVEDGSTFVRLTFDEEYQKHASSILFYELKVTDALDTVTGKTRRRYQGHVKARGSTWAAAKDAALAQARTLGDNKFQFKLSANEDYDDRGPYDPADPAKRLAGGDLFVRVDFTYEYQIKGTRVYIELASRVSEDKFGLDAEQVSGFIVAADHAACDTELASIKSAYSALMIRTEEKGYEKERIGDINLSTGAALGTRTEHQTRLTFGFNVHRVKADSATAMRYQMTVNTDYRSRTMVTIVSGDLWASSRAVADAYLDTFLSGLGFTNNLNSSRKESNDKAPAPSGTQLAVFTGLNFEETFEAALSGDAAIIECSIDEEIECSGTRIIAQPTAISTDVLQECGIVHGKRMVRASCLATDETTAKTWVKKHRSLPQGGDVTTNGTSKTLPERWQIKPEFVALTEGYLRSGTYGGTENGANAKMVRVLGEFATLFTEITVA